MISAEATLASGGVVALTPYKSYSLGEGFIYKAGESDVTIKVTVKEDKTHKIVVDKTDITGYEAYTKGTSFFTNPLSEQGLTKVSEGTEVFFKFSVAEDKAVSKIEAKLASGEVVALTPHKDLLKDKGFIFKMGTSDATIKVSVIQHQKHKITIDKSEGAECTVYKKGGYFYNEEVTE